MPEFMDEVIKQAAKEIAKGGSISEGTYVAPDTLPSVYVNRMSNWQLCEFLAAIFNKAVSDA